MALWQAYIGRYLLAAARLEFLERQVQTQSDYGVWNK